MNTTAPGIAAANDDGDLISQARQAWRTKQDAEAHLARMRKYRRLTDGMKSDRSRHERRLAEANVTLRRILGDAA